VNGTRRPWTVAGKLKSPLAKTDFESVDDNIASQPKVV
jgi:hypothetical protein